MRSTERRIFNFSVIESLMMMCMAGLQVFIVRFFFQVCFLSLSLFPCAWVLVLTLGWLGCEEGLCVKGIGLGGEYCIGGVDELLSVYFYDRRNEQSNEFPRWYDGVEWVMPYQLHYCDI